MLGWLSSTAAGGSSLASDSPSVSRPGRRSPTLGASVAGFAPPHATEVAFLGLLRHRTRVDVVQEMFYWSLQAGGILVMAVAPPRVCVLMAGLSWVP